MSARLRSFLDVVCDIISTPSMAEQRRRLSFPSYRSESHPDSSYIPCAAPQHSFVPRAPVAIIISHPYPAVPRRVGPIFVAAALVALPALSVRAISYCGPIPMQVEMETEHS